MRATAAYLFLLVAAAGCHLVFPHAPGSAPARELGPDASDSGALDARRDRSWQDRGGDSGLDPLRCARRTLALSAAEDDGEIEGSVGFLPKGESPQPPELDGIYIGHWWNGPTWGFFRFALSDALPTGAVVTRARLRLRGIYRTTGWDPERDALQVSLEESHDAAVVTDDREAPGKDQARPLVAVSGSSFLRWPPAGGLDWAVGINESSELAPLVQALVSKQGGLAKGAHLLLWLRGTRSEGAAEVTTPAFELVDAPSAWLTLEWCR